ncbi:MAG TPA: bifunctional adenosylcobinamide kinase/adenosylcobinamide-phosphate guanylyltransferase [Ureibacillus sp.]|nr:bifunctional adenosylcobinamide kinase/adenosylcobinamide-phosphate guanylyltransferase [Ureibacillus sp.]
MQVVIGGAYNGKRKFVEEKLLRSTTGTPHFFEGQMPEIGLFTKEDILIIGHFEKLILEHVHLDEDEIAEKIFNVLIELNKRAQVICICTDIGRGVVPLRKEERKLRDTCGRLYQKLFTDSERVIRIWYGLPQMIKGEEL